MTGKFFMNERRKVLWAVAGVAVYSAAVVELNSSLSSTRLASSTSHDAAYTGYARRDPLLEAASLRAEATRACQSLSPEEQDRNIERTTDLDGMDSFLAFRQKALESFYESDLTALNAYRTAILQGCLVTRNAPGDQEMADRISEIRFD